MTLVPTAILAVIALISTLFCGWRGAIKPKALAAPRMAPWRGLMLLSFLGLLLMLVHLVTLFRHGSA